MISKIKNKRATSTEEKAERLQQVTSAAGKLLSSCDVTEISMRQIAAKAGIGKASLYHYFNSREQVFLEVLLLECQSYSDSLIARLSRMRKPTVERVCHAIAGEFTAHKHLCQLFSVQAAVLEKNASADNLRQFKTKILSYITSIGEVLTHKLPGLDAPSARLFLQQTHIIVVGLWPLANPNEQSIAATDIESLHIFRIDFNQSLVAMLQPLLQNMIKKKKSD